MLHKTLQRQSFGTSGVRSKAAVALRCAVVVATATFVGASAHSVGASSPLPAGAGDFVPTVDIGSAMKDIVSLASTPCKVGQSNVSELPAGETLTLPASDLMKALTIGNAMKAKADSLATLSCSAALNLAASEKSINGTITNAALNLSGTFALKCTFEQNLKVDADLSLGMALARGATVTVKSADNTIPMTCSMSASLSDGTSIAGSVDGVAKVGTLVSDSCTGDTQRTCVPLSISATVNVTSATGRFAGYVGTGTYDLTPSFTVPPLNDSLGSFVGLLGKSSVRVSSVSPRVASNTGSMKISFSPGAARTEIVHPGVTAAGTSVLASGDLFAAVGPRSSNCVFSLAKGKKSYTFAKVKLAADGTMLAKSLTNTQYSGIKKQLGAKTGNALKMTALCGTARATQSVTLG